MADLQQEQINQANANMELQKSLYEKEYKRSAKVKALDKAQQKSSVKLFLEEATEIYDWLIKE